MTQDHQTYISRYAQPLVGGICSTSCRSPANRVPASSQYNLRCSSSSPQICRISSVSPMYLMSAGAFKQALSNSWPQKTQRQKNRNFPPGRLGSWNKNLEKHCKNAEIPHFGSLPSGGQTCLDKNWTKYEFSGFKSLRCYLLE